MSTEPRIPRVLERAPDFTPVCTQEFIEFARRADLDQKVSQAYGLVHEAVSDTATRRAVFVIDPKQNIRATVYYPRQLGRKVEELVQVSWRCERSTTIVYPRPPIGSRANRSWFRPRLH